MKQAASEGRRMQYSFPRVNAHLPSKEGRNVSQLKGEQTKPLLPAYPSVKPYLTVLM